MTNLSYQHIRIRECGDPMIDLAHYPFILSPEYFNAGLSDSDTLWTRKTIADKLANIQDHMLTSKGMIFKIWDAWRPRSVQANIYNKYLTKLKTSHPDWDDTRLEHEVGVFVTKPDDKTKIPPHATGGSIDLTIAQASNEDELDMGTGFDHFGPESAPDFHKYGPVADNRNFFIDLMLSAGFTGDPDEWWHFDYGNQKWAVNADASEAVFGEVTDPRAFNQEHSQARHVG